MSGIGSSSEISMREYRLSPEVSVSLCVEGDRLLGIGAVTVSGVPIRANAVPLRPDFSTPDAIHYQDFRLLGIEEGEGQLVLKTEAIGRPEVFGEMMDEYSYNLAFPSVRSVQHDTLDWIIQPQELILDAQRYVGLSLGFQFTSATNEIHRVTTMATWEIGGHADGNTIYHQAYSCPPVYEATLDNHFTSTCLKRLDLWNNWLGHSFQMLPRWGAIQPFDFLAARDGVLLGYWKDPHSVKSLVQKNPGEDVIFVLDEHDFPLTNTVTVPAKHILFSVSTEERPKEAVVDMWTRAMDYVTETIRGYFGIKTCQPLPGGGPHYAGRNSVPRNELADGPQDDWLWRIENGKFYFMLEGQKIESRDFLYWTADNILPRLKAQGLKRVWFEPIHESDFTEDCFANHAEMGWHSDLVVTSICGSRRYVPSQFYDGWRGWNYLAEKARALDLSLGHWVGLHLTPRAPIVQEHPDYILQHVNTLGHGGGYSHLAICSINWCSGAKQWFLDDMKRWHDEGGLEWLFFDSWPNLCCTPLNYGGRMEPMQWEAGKLLADLQQIGYNWFSFEGTSPFGVHQYGLWDPMQDYEKHTAHGVAGQNDFGWWMGHEYMGYNQTLGPNINARRDREHFLELAFRYVANRSLTLTQQWAFLDVSDRHPDATIYAQTYQALQPLMQKRFLLPDDRGVRWESGDGCQVVFSYRPFIFPVSQGARVVKVEGTRENPVTISGDGLHTEAWTAYRIE